MSNASWLWTRAQWRRRRGAALASTVLLALAVSVVLSAAVGARRTQTALLALAGGTLLARTHPAIALRSE